MRYHHVVPLKTFRNFHASFLVTELIYSPPAVSLLEQSEPNTYSSVHYFRSCFSGIPRKVFFSSVMSFNFIDDQNLQQSCPFVCYRVDRKEMVLSDWKPKPAFSNYFRPKNSLLGVLVFSKYDGFRAY